MTHQTCDIASATAANTPWRWAETHVNVSFKQCNGAFRQLFWRDPLPSELTFAGNSAQLDVSRRAPEKTLDQRRNPHLGFGVKLHSQLLFGGSRFGSHF
jgi:hypothetical protein